jgi:hypothetical protein
MSHCTISLCPPPLRRMSMTSALVCATNVIAAVAVGAAQSSGANTRRSRNPTLSGRISTLLNPKLICGP